MNRTRRTRSAFTLIELLTVIAIITLLIGILTPALGKARDQAKNAAIKAQLHSIGTGLEMFQGEQGKYAPSNAADYGNGNAAAMAAWEVVNGGSPMQGANLLVDAMVGRDFLGYDPKPSGTVGGVPYDRWNRDNSRRPKYIDPTGIDSSIKSEPVKFGFGTGPNPVADTDEFTPTMPAGPVSTTNSSPQYCPVFLDKFGFPILYYASNPSASQRSPMLPKVAPNGTTFLTSDNPVYNGYDNQNFTRFNVGTNNGQKHEIDNADDVLNTDDDLNNNFARYIYSDRASSKDTNGNITYLRPFNESKFLLISAGKDGIYGTLDDQTNFK